MEKMRALSKELKKVEDDSGKGSINLVYARVGKNT